MEKQLKDYLHLYLGCEMEVKHKQIAILSGVSYDERGKYFIHLNDKENGYYILFIQEAKPILRPLSDISEEEAREGQWRDEKDFAGFCEVHKFNNSHRWFADDFKFLLSKGFDLFGLIESGLAIDKTKLQTH